MNESVVVHVMVGELEQAEGEEGKGEHENHYRQGFGGRHHPRVEPPRTLVLCAHLDGRKHFSDLLLAAPDRRQYQDVEHPTEEQREEVVDQVEEDLQFAFIEHKQRQAEPKVGFPV